ncbi:MAG: lysophospholipid acyltransferase family protein [Elusimicrobia bacterium]|nr:lysophospholipid acyltransferase family protein [Elusimicrobiota bacterium]
MRKLKYLLQYYAIITTAFTLRSLHLKLARFFARRLGDLNYYLVGIRRKTVSKNLSESFPEKSHAEIRLIARNTFRQILTTFIELAFFPKWTKDDLNKIIIIKGKEVIDDAFEKGKGVIFVTTHFCNWELLGSIVSLNYPLNAIAATQSNNKLDNLINSYRKAKSLKIIPMNFAARGIIQALKKHESVAFLSDQDAGINGTFVNFFGRLTSTPKGTAVFALRQGCPLIFGIIFRDNDKFIASFEYVPKPLLTGDEEKDIQNYTQAYTTMLENYVRKYPDHYYWVHRRWKTRPPSESS